MPYKFQIDPKVLVNHDVPHPGYIPQGNLRMFSFKLFGKVLDRFANYLDSSDDFVLEVTDPNKST
jgi:hypothetical protein